MADIVRRARRQRRTGRSRRLGVWGFLYLAAAVGVSPVVGQISPDPNPVEESRLLREAATRESVGDFRGAERLLLTLLDRNPTSSGGLFALERVLRAQGRIGQILPRADAYLEHASTAAAPRYLKLRVLVEVDSTSVLTDEAEAWIEADPRSPDPYREVARVYERAFDARRALEVLERGRSALDDPTALAMETGDLLVRIGDYEDAVDEWSRAVGEDGTQVATLIRRINQLPGDRKALVRPLVKSLGDRPTTTARQRAGARIALEVGLEDEAMELARDVTPELAEPARRGFLTEISRKAEEKGADGVALWAFEQLRRGASEGAEARALDQRIATSALELGDTAAAVEAQYRIAEGLPPASTERRRALATALRLESVDEWRSVKRRLDSFRSEYPHAPELDDLASALSARFQGQGEPDAAAEILAGIEGPRSALQRAYLRLSGQDPAEARDDLLQAAAGLPPSQATDVIELANLLGNLSAPSAKLAAEATVLSQQGDSRGATTLIREKMPEVQGGDQAPLLALGARIADEAGLDVEAAGFREALLAEHLDAPESAEASLDLARYLSRDGGDLARAAQILEELILQRPGSPVAPAARRELERIRRRSIPGGSG